MCAIYQDTREKLMHHGVCETSAGRLILADATLFLKFVQLERAVRQDDFDHVQTAMRALETHACMIGKRQLLVYAYLYLMFPKTPENRQQAQHHPVSENGAPDNAAITADSTLIRSWAQRQFDRYGPAFFRALAMKA